MSVKAKVILIGLFMIFAAVWGGAVGLHFFEEWTHFPFLLTSIVVALLGFGVVFYSTKDE